MILFIPDKLSNYSNYPKTSQARSPKQPQLSLTDQRPSAERRQIDAPTFDGLLLDAKCELSYISQPISWSWQFQNTCIYIYIYAVIYIYIYMGMYIYKYI